jgi:hypothetical protein
MLRRLFRRQIAAIARGEDPSASTAATDPLVELDASTTSSIATTAVSPVSSTTHRQLPTATPTPGHAVTTSMVERVDLLEAHTAARDFDLDRLVRMWRGTEHGLPGAAPADGYLTRASPEIRDRPEHALRMSPDRHDCEPREGGRSRRPLHDGLRSRQRREVHCMRARQAPGHQSWSASRMIADASVWRQRREAPPRTRRE